jgi:hypothetical protein
MAIKIDAASRLVAGNEQAQSEFISVITELQAQLGKLKSLVDENMGEDPDAINWGHVGTVKKVSKDMKEILRFLNIK